jgi:uncharacterized phage protein (TIGR01671 family)
MREIKFRGKRLDNGKWVYGDLHIRTPFPHIHSEIDFGRVNIDPHTVGQFTGLHDRYGEEIYEGDIVKWNLTIPGVGVNGGYEEYEIEEIGEIQWDAGALHLGEYCAAGFAYESEDYAEIIGNIHDNPELLKTE